MATLLQLKTSIFGDAGYSSQLANEFAAQWQTQHPGGQVIVRDLAAEPLPHFSAEHIAAFSTPAEARTPEQQALADLSDALIAELKQADVLVIGLPMYNFGIPSTLKAYLDQISRAGLTFKYTEQGAEGLLADKPTYVFASRGGFYAGTALDTETGYVRDFFSFLGIKTIEFVYAEGLNITPDTKESALNAARQRLTELAAA